MRVLLAAVLLFSLSPSGCGSSNALCSLEARAGVSVTLKDATTGERICDAKVIITDGAEVRDDAQPVGPDCLYSGAVERTGTFEVEITHPSYAPATRDGIEVKMDEAGCHVETQRIDVALSK